MELTTKEDQRINIRDWHIVKDRSNLTKHTVDIVKDNCLVKDSDGLQLIN